MLGHLRRRRQANGEPEPQSPSCSGAVPAKMVASKFSFATTLAAVDEPVNRSGSMSRFEKFSDLPPEIRIAIWECILPTAGDETPAVFVQRPWGMLEVPDGMVPIRMTTTCAALLHVNQESRRITLSWAENLGYKLSYRATCFDSEYWDECDAILEDDNPAVVRQDKQIRENLPVQGPIFVRPWDASKDILSVTYTAEPQLYIIPQSSDDDCYTTGRQFPNVRYLAFNLKKNSGCTSSRWFYQHIAAMPDLKSISFDYDHHEDPRVMEEFEERYIETGEVLDLTAGCGREQSRRDARVDECCRVRARWEPVDCEPEEMRYSQDIEMFQWYLMEGYLEHDMWTPKGAPEEEHEEYLSRENLQTVPPWIRRADNDRVPPWDRPHDKAKMERVPPWIWNHEKGEFAVEVGLFRMVERRGYDDVGDGHVVKCKNLYGDIYVREHEQTRE